MKPIKGELHMSNNYREFNAKLWEKMAEPWDKRRDWQEKSVRPVTDAMLLQLKPQSGQTILELAGGNGESGLLVAQRLGNHGRLILTDLAPSMVKSAERRGQELGLSNVEYQAMDAENITLDDNSVDGVLCRWGYMLMPDGDKALAETRRVLRPSGILTFAVWAEAQENPFFTVPAGVLIEKGFFKPDPSAPNMFTLGSPNNLAAFVQKAGFSLPVVERVPITYTFEDSNDWWSFVSEFAGPVALTISLLGEDDQKNVRSEIEQRSEKFRNGERYAFPGVCLVVGTH